ncbi:MAG: cytoskeletal protein binding protein [Piccolia ochrophora]|nr:MAG: cytoskeletal protein binding protein [Piccolia ochrophora]
MGFLGVYTAIYDYAPQGESELSIQEGDLLFVLEKSDEDDWWKAKKRAAGDDEDEPVGLIPSNYIEEAHPTTQAKALYDYTRQTDEELSFSEDAALAVYDTSDPDWTLVGCNGEYGFAPANYIDVSDASTGPSLASPTSHAREVQPEDEEPEQMMTPTSTESPGQSPAAALAGILQQRTSTTAPDDSAQDHAAQQPRRQTYTPEVSDEETPSPPAPILPVRPPSEELSLASPKRTPRSPPTAGILASPPSNRVTHRDADEADEAPIRSPGGYHLYNINEMVTAMGKRKKMPTTLGINIATGTIMIAPEKSRDGPQQEWTADRMTHYSIEGKHVFLELVRPSKSIDFHAGAKDTAEEIVSALGEISGASRAEGLREVIAAGSRSSTAQKKGLVLYDFTAQGDDEVTVAVDDEVMILDDAKSDEWWMVRRIKNGKEGVVPSSYVEVIGVTSVSSPLTSGLNAGRSTVEQNRLEEQRLAKQAARSRPAREDIEANESEVGPGVRLPKRGSSLMGKGTAQRQSSQRSRREGRAEGKVSGHKSNRSASFKVEAEFIGCTEGKIHLHKLNGVKIAVPVAKMSMEDLEFVERITGISLDEDKPLSDIKRRTQPAISQDKSKSGGGPTQSTSRTPREQANKDEYDWFDFFLSCGVGPHQCERYASSFSKDSMDETVLPDITPNVLRTLGLKEGDILRVMKFLDSKYGRSNDSRAKRNVSFGGAEVIGNGDDPDGQSAESHSVPAGGLFSGSGGALRNNTRKGRPVPPVQTNDLINAKAFQQKERTESGKNSHISHSAATTPTSAPPPAKKDAVGFDDDAWDVKPSKQSGPPSSSTTPNTQGATSQPTVQNPALSDSMKDLSLLSAPLQPTRTQTTAGQQQNVSIPPAQSQQPTGATQSFFANMGPSQTTGQPQPGNAGFPQQQQQAPGPSRQRPQAPSQPSNIQNSLMPPPPPRPLSAPQNASNQNTFGPPPLQPQLTGVQLSTAYQPQIAPPGQSLNDINQMRMQQLAQSQAPAFPQQVTGMPMQPAGSPFGNGIPAQQTGFGQSQFSQGYQHPQPTGSPFGNVMQQPTGGMQQIASQPQGFQPSFSSAPQQQPQQTGVNSFLPPALRPQPTGSSPVGQGFGQPPPVPPIPQQPTVAPLQPQQTGPAPPVRFGVTGDAKKLMPQATGRRANLSQATPQNPFGF